MENQRSYEDRIVELEIEIASLRFNLANARNPNGTWIGRAKFRLAALEAQLESAYAALRRIAQVTA